MGDELESQRDRRVTAEEPGPPAAIQFCDSNLPATAATVRFDLPHQLANRGRPSCQTRRRAPQTPENTHDHEFLAVFSHEMRGSLGAIRNAAHLLGLQGGETPLAEQARLLIERQVARMTRLADDLIDTARLRSQPQPLRRERIDLRVVLQYSIETVESAIAAHGHRLTTVLPDAPVWVYADAGRLEQVFVNLLANAAKYTDRGGDLSLGVQLADSDVTVRICDSGIGIAADTLPRVFNLFMQVDASSRRSAAGLGIGLALVRSLVELHGGRVSASSAGLGHGSQFAVRLPVF